MKPTHLCVGAPNVPQGLPLLANSLTRSKPKAGRSFWHRRERVPKQYYSRLGTTTKRGKILLLKIQDQTQGSASLSLGTTQDNQAFQVF